MVTEALRTYVQTQRAAGYSDEAIAQVLVSGGWTSEDARTVLSESPDGVSTERENLGQSADEPHAGTRNDDPSSQHPAVSPELKLVTPVHAPSVTSAITDDEQSVMRPDESERSKVPRRRILVLGGVLLSFAFVIGAAAFYVLEREPTPDEVIARIAESLGGVESFTYRMVLHGDASGHALPAGDPEFPGTGSGEITLTTNGSVDRRERTASTTIEVEGSALAMGVGFAVDAKADLIMIGDRLYVRVAHFPEILSIVDVDGSIRRAWEGVWVAIDRSTVGEEFAGEFPVGDVSFFGSSTVRGEITPREAQKLRAIFLQTKPVTMTPVKDGLEAEKGIPVRRYAIQVSEVGMRRFVAETRRQVPALLHEAPFSLSLAGEEEVYRMLGTMRASLAVGRDDYLPRSLSIAIPYSSSTDGMLIEGNLRFDMELWGYGESPAIIAPVDARPAEELKTFLESRFNGLVNATPAARDKSRISKLLDAQLALSLYRDETGVYPQTLGELPLQYLPKAELAGDPFPEVIYIPLRDRGAGGVSLCPQASRVCDRAILAVSLEEGDEESLSLDRDLLFLERGFYGADTAGCRKEEGMSCLDLLIGGE